MSILLTDAERSRLHKTVDGKRLAPDDNDNWYICQYEWPDEFFIQCGGHDMLGQAFFEYFPHYVRTDAATIEEAEDKAWKIYQIQKSCKLDHADTNNFDREGYTNGLAFCKECGFNTNLEPTEKCHNCNEFTYYTQDINKNWWCKTCANTVMPKQIMNRDMLRLFEKNK